MNVLIIGGEIASNALAFWVAKLGHDITLVERFPSLRATGLQIDLRGHGIEVMRRLGLEGTFRAKSAPEQEHLKNTRPENVSQEKDAITNMFQGAGWQCEQIVDPMKDAPDFSCERMALVKLDSWHRGGVALLGDAAYCPTANTGMGTTSSIVGASILSAEIGRHCGKYKAEGGLSTALKEYESKFQPLMTQIPEGVLEHRKDSTWDLISSSRWGVTAMNLLVEIASLLKIELGKYMVKEEVKGWILPEYEELTRD